MSVLPSHEALDPQGHAISDADFDRVRTLLAKLAGISLSDAKRQLVVSRLKRRLIALGLPSFGAYCNLLESPTGAAELQTFVNRLTTNKTDFFREPHHFDILRDRVVPEFLRSARQGRRHTLRVWCAASSSGEEPWTLAIVLADALKRMPEVDFRIDASDIDTEVLAKANRAVYPMSAIDVPELTDSGRFFLRGTGSHAGTVRVRDELRAKVSFRPLNLNESSETWGWPKKFDAIFCRNVLIYFNRATQIDVTERLVSQLSPGGWLFFGHAESVAATNAEIERVGQTAYRLRSSDSASSPPPDAARKVARPSIVAPNGAPRFSRSARVEERRDETRASRQAAPPEELQVTLGIGDVYATAAPAILRTVLGSCVAACLYDPVAHVGGMCHFLLPSARDDDGSSTRYGVNALERLINATMGAGADRRRLRVKAFGGAHLFGPDASFGRIGERNSSFIREFFLREGIPLVSELLEGANALKVLFYPHSGKAMVAPVSTSSGPSLSQREAAAVSRIAQAEHANANDRVTLF